MEADGGVVCSWLEVYLRSVFLVYLDMPVTDCCLSWYLTDYIPLRWGVRDYEAYSVKLMEINESELLLLCLFINCFMPGLIRYIIWEY